MYIVGKYIIHLHSFRNRTEKPTNGMFFCLFLKLVQIDFPKMYVLYIYTHCVYFGLGEYAHVLVMIYI